MLLILPWSRVRVQPPLLAPEGENREQIKKDIEVLAKV
jgi:hypothetical protein